jgi:hypothetical protein
MNQEPSPNYAQLAVIDSLHPSVRPLAHAARLSTTEARVLSHFLDYTERLRDCPADRLQQLAVDHACMVARIFTRSLPPPPDPANAIIPADLASARVAATIAGIRQESIDRLARQGRITRYGARFRYRYSLGELLRVQPACNPAT